MAAKSGVAVFSVSVPQAATDWLSVRLGVFVRECVCVSSCGRTRNERETALSLPPSISLPFLMINTEHVASPMMQQRRMKEKDAGKNITK